MYGLCVQCPSVFDDLFSSNAFSDHSFSTLLASPTILFLLCPLAFVICPVKHGLEEWDSFSKQLIICILHRWGVGGEECFNSAKSQYSHFSFSLFFLGYLCCVSHMMYYVLSQIWRISVVLCVSRCNCRVVVIKRRV